MPREVAYAEGFGPTIKAAAAEKMLRFTGCFVTIHDMDANRPHRRRWYQFSLRTLLMAMLICGPVGGWVAKRVNTYFAERRLAKEWESVGGSGRIVAFPPIRCYFGAQSDETEKEVQTSNQSPAPSDSE